MTDLSPTATEIDELSLTVDRYNCYPGELLTISTRFICPPDAMGELQIILPRVMNVESLDLPAGVSDEIMSVLEREQELILLFPLKTYFKEEQAYEIKVRARVNTFYIDQYLSLRSDLLNGKKQKLASEELEVVVFGKGKYLKYLPEIYESDEFVGRFLMLIESFWKPISQQVDQIDSYFDPSLTPDAFIPWLASWVGMPMDSFLPLDRVRILLKNAMSLNQRRGTRHALITFLEIYTSGKVDISERRSRNFILGQKSNLGIEIGLGKNNKPNSILIDIEAPESELGRTGYTKDMYQRKMSSVVRSLVPAQTVYDVRCTFIPAG
jgi:phage tail-like protein